MMRSKICVRVASTEALHPVCGHVCRCTCGTYFCWLCGARTGSKGDPNDRVHAHFGVANTKCYGKAFDGCHVDG